MIRPRTLALGVLAAALAVSATSLPASAHDSLISSTPEPGERLASAPGEVSLRFSDDVLTVGSAIIVADAEGRDWVTSEVIILGDTVSAELDPGLPDAGYEIRWRVVSSDGHPISGLVPFTVGDGTPIERTAPDPSPGDAERPGAPGTIDTAAEEPGQVAGGSGGFPRVIALGIGGAAIALAIAGVITLIRRRARAGTAPDTAATPDSRDDVREQHLL